MEEFELTDEQADKLNRAMSGQEVELDDSEAELLNKVISSSNKPKFTHPEGVSPNSPLGAAMSKDPTAQSYTVDGFTFDKTGKQVPGTPGYVQPGGFSQKPTSEDLAEKALTFGNKALFSLPGRIANAAPGDYDYNKNFSQIEERQPGAALVGDVTSGVIGGVAGRAAAGGAAGFKALSTTGQMMNNIGSSVAGNIVSQSATANRFEPGSLLASAAIPAVISGAGAGVGKYLDYKTTGAVNRLADLPEMDVDGAVARVRKLLTEADEKTINILGIDSATQRDLINRPQQNWNTIKFINDILTKSANANNVARNASEAATAANKAAANDLAQRLPGQVVDPDAVRAGIAGIAGKTSNSDVVDIAKTLQHRINNLPTHEVVRGYAIPPSTTPLGPQQLALAKQTKQAANLRPITEQVTNPLKPEYVQQEINAIQAPNFQIGYPGKVGSTVGTKAVGEVSRGLDDINRTMGGYGDYIQYQKMLDDRAAKNLVANNSVFKMNQSIVDDPHSVRLSAMGSNGLLPRAAVSLGLDTPIRAVKGWRLGSKVEEIEQLMDAINSNAGHITDNPIELEKLTRALGGIKLAKPQDRAAMMYVLSISNPIMTAVLNSDVIDNYMKGERKPVPGPYDSLNLASPQ